MKSKVQKERYFEGYFSRFNTLPALIESKPDLNLAMCIVIPSFKEPGLIESIRSIARCDPPERPIEVIVVVNSPEPSPPEAIHVNQQSRVDLELFKKDEKPPWMDLHVLNFDRLSRKNSGVGAARKIGMDEAARRFAHTKIRGDGLLVCFDADSVCDPNYLCVLEQYTLEQKGSPGCSLYFEHPIDPVHTSAEQEAIVYYELHLRTYRNAMKWCGFPYAFHTVGSAMASRVWSYQMQGGMNRRKAGEDFYFLHKIIPLGNFKEINQTRVIPSPRASDRVPFGTGRAVDAWLKGNKSEGSTYNLASFQDLKSLFLQIDGYWDGEQSIEPPNPVLKEFLDSNGFNKALIEMRQHASNISTFRKRFFAWFDAFRLMKYLHWARDQGRSDTNTIKTALDLLRQLDVANGSISPKVEPLDVLSLYRHLDRLSPQL